MVSRLHPGIRTVKLEVETITARLDWALALCDQLKAYNAGRPFPLAFGCNVRVTPHMRPDSLFASMRAANFTHLNIGLESGSERVREEILRRHYSNDDVLSTVTAARKHGLRVGFFNLIGIPGETYEDFLETVRMNRLCAPDEHATSIFEPYPGTELHRLCEEKGYLPGAHTDPQGRMRSQLDLPGFPKSRIQHCSDWFDYYVFKGRMSSFQLSLRLGARWFRSSRLLSALSRFRSVVRLLRFLQVRRTSASRQGPP
jgi:anaerobic magnesium-protoporphyrin IX monomethyl ester cyclase